MRRRSVALLVVALLALVVVLYFNPPASFVDPGEYDTTTVTVSDENGTELATVDVKLADTAEKRQVGLSRTDSLDDDAGMLFVHPEADTHTYNMRNMSFPLDIVFVAPNGTITEIHQADVPTLWPFERYSGDGKYVLEVEQGWTSEAGVEPGDVVHIPENVTAQDS